MDHSGEEPADYALQPLTGSHPTRQGKTRSKIGPQFVATLTSTLTSLSFGFHSGWSSPSLAKLLSKDSDIPVTPSQAVWIVAFLPVGSLCSSLFVPVMADTWGRKTSLLFSAIPCFIGSTIIAFAQSYKWLYFSRFIIGLGIGVVLAIAPMYVGEIAEVRLRGALGAFLNYMVNLGLVIAFCVGPWVNRQALAAVGAAIPCIFILAFFWIPESPYFLIMKKNSARSHKSLQWLRGTPDVAEELKAIEQNVEFNLRNTGTFQELVTVPAIRRAVIITNGLMFAQQFSGISAINAYSSLIFQAAGAELSTNVSLMIVALIQLICGFMSIMVPNLAGRRTLLLISVFGSCIFLSSNAMYFQLQAAGINVVPVFWLPLAAIVGYIFCYTVGLGIIPPSIFAELYPCNVKAKGLMVLNVTGLIFLTVETKMYQLIADTYGIQYAFWFFTVITACSGIFIYLFVPETRNKSLDEIQDHLRAVTQPKSAPPRTKNNVDANSYSS